jgi:hypothetical protein
MFHNRFYAPLGSHQGLPRRAPQRERDSDRLREQRRLPEQTDLPRGRARLEFFKNARPASEELWHVPAAPRCASAAPAGGGRFVYLFEDVSEQFRQKSAHADQGSAGNAGYAAGKVGCSAPTAG